MFDEIDFVVIVYVWFLIVCLKLDIFDVYCLSMLFFIGYVVREEKDSIECKEDFDFESDSDDDDGVFEFVD